MRIRRDAVLVSSLMLTVAFLCLVPPNWENAQAGHDKAALAHMGSGFADYAVLLGQFGVANLAMILVALIIIWKGYVKKVRWAWVLLFVIVWGWYFPPYVLPSLSSLRGFDLVMWLSSLAHASAWSYSPPVWVLILLLMLVALILPIRSFFSPAAEASAPRG